MYQYPSIPGPSKAPHLPCIAFYKYDGSNLRFEYSRKRGWYKFGTRRRLFDHTDEEFGQAISIFRETLAPGIEAIVSKDKVMSNAGHVTAFCEFFGQNSFAGNHEAGDPKELILIDFHVHKKGLMAPREFVNTFGGLKSAKVVYDGVLNQTLIDDVRRNAYGLKEGVVCKGGSGHGLWMCKIKTNEYLEKIKANLANWQEYWE